MMRSRMVKTVLWCLLIWLSCTRHVHAYETGGVTKAILSNGVTILVRREPEAKVAAIEIFVRMRASDENEANTGIGQLLAVSIFAGTETYSAVRLARLVNQVGGNFHAVWQWNYMELYAVTLPDTCEETISLLADALRNSKLDPKAVDFSRSAILKEVQRQQDDPFNSAYASVRRLVQRGTRYDRPYLGDADKLRAISPRQLKEFHHRILSSDRIVISVVGDVDPRRVARKVEVCFGNMSRLGSTSEETPEPDPRAGAAIVQRAGSSTYVMLGFPAPGVENPDYPAMCLANVLLGGNKSSLLFRKLREERGLGYQVGSLYPALRGESHLAAYVGLDSTRATPEALEAVQAAITEQVNVLRSGDFTDQDLERAKRFLVGKHALKHERTRDRAFYLGWHEAIGLGYQYDFQYADKIKAVTKGDVVHTCSRFFDSTGGSH